MIFSKKCIVKLDVNVGCWVQLLIVALYSEFGGIPPTSRFDKDRVVSLEVSGAVVDCRGYFLTTAWTRVAASFNSFSSQYAVVADRRSAIVLIRSKRSITWLADGRRYSTYEVLAHFTR